jgi:hypothetical protein
MSALREASHRSGEATAEEISNSERLVVPKEDTQVEPATPTQRNFLSLLGYLPSCELGRHEAAQLISRVVRPINFAIVETFTRTLKEWELRDKEHLRTLQTALSNSASITAFPRFGPNVTWSGLRDEVTDKLTEEQRCEVFELACLVLPSTLVSKLSLRDFRRYPKLIALRKALGRRIWQEKDDPAI